MGMGTAPAAHGRIEANISTEQGRETNEKVWESKATGALLWLGTQAGEGHSTSLGLSWPTLRQNDTTATLTMPNAQACEP